MMSSTGAHDWFLKAQRAYAELHQGCAWCGSQYAVRRERKGPKQIYSCQHCDFQVSHDTLANRFHAVPGEEISPASQTMHELPVSNF
jgi:transposase-like protein